MMTTGFLWKIHGSKHKKVFEKGNVHLKGEHNERFSRMQKWTQICVWLDKIAIFETLV